MASNIPEDDLVEWAAAQPGATVPQIERAIHMANLFDAVPNARLADLGLRHKAGHLTPAETLALRILEGQADAVMGAVDAAQEEYANGTYRVPVRVVADWNKALLVLTAPESWAQDDCDRAFEYLTRSRDRLAAGGGSVLVLNAGVRIEIFESATGGVEVKQGGGVMDDADKRAQAIAWGDGWSRTEYYTDADGDEYPNEAFDRGALAELIAGAIREAVAAERDRAEALRREAKAWLLGGGEEHGRPQQRDRERGRATGVGVGDRTPGRAGVVLAPGVRRGAAVRAAGGVQRRRGAEAGLHDGGADGGLRVVRPAAGAQRLRLHGRGGVVDCRLLHHNVTR